MKMCDEGKETVYEQTVPVISVETQGELMGFQVKAPEGTRESAIKDTLQ